MQATPPCRPHPRRARTRRSLTRRSKIRRIRAAIRAGEYENPLKLHIAIDRVMDRICNRW